jgi:hypothetical protein
MFRTSDLTGFANFSSRRVRFVFPSAFDFCSNLQLDWLTFQMYSNCWYSMQVSAYLEINDIAGLVRGASAGEGLGNAFLSHIRAVDGIFHVLSMFLL